MIITLNGIIVFHLVEWIGGIQQIKERVERLNMLAFAYQAIPSMHEVPGKPADDVIN